MCVEHRDGDGSWFKTRQRPEADKAEAWVATTGQPGPKTRLDPRSMQMEMMMMMIGVAVGADGTYVQS
jgi:hypothetical protein